MGVDYVHKILLLEDNQDDAYLILRALQRQGFAFISERVDTREEFTESLQRFQPDVVLSDHGLPSFSSHEALKLLQLKDVSVSFIMVSGVQSSKQDFNGLAEGPDDYILKSDLSRLALTIQAAINKKKRN